MNKAEQKGKLKEPSRPASRLQPPEELRRGWSGGAERDPAGRAPWGQPGATRPCGPRGQELPAGEAAWKREAAACLCSSNSRGGDRSRASRRTATGPSFGERIAPAPRIRVAGGKSDVCSGDLRSIGELGGRARRDRLTSAGTADPATLRS